MTAPNHIVGGFTFTGIFAAIGGINILQDYRLLPIILFATLLPDIDHTKSIIGKAFYPIAKVINRKYGHRTITHSLIVLVALTAGISAFQSAYFPSIKAAQVFGLAYASHLIFDMMTVQGVPLFYPFKKNPCVLPGNPEMRLRTSSVRQETAVFCFFMVSAIFMKPLFANGFWTSYNSLFGSLKHIVSEYNKSEDLILVDFTVQHGSELSKHTGLCIEVSSSDITIITKRKLFQSYPAEGQMIKDIYPKHTRMNHSYQQGQFHDLSMDSVHALFRRGKYTRFELQGSDQFLYIEDGIERKKRKLKLDYPNQLILREIPDSTVVEYITNPSIQSKREEIHMYRTIHEQELESYNDERDNYLSMEEQIKQEHNHITKELLMIEFSKLKRPTPPAPIDQKINRLQSDIRALQQKDTQDYQKALKAAERPELSFSGSYERLLINGKSL